MDTRSHNSLPIAYFMQQKKYVKDPVEIHNIKQRDGETIEEFMERFKVETGRMKGAPECMRISGFMHGVNNPELTKRLNEHVPKTMEEMMIATTAFIRRLSPPRWQKRKVTHHEGHRTSQIRTLQSRGKFKPPPPMVTPVEKRSSNKFCDFHNDKGYSTDECMQLKKQIEELVRAGKLSHLIKEIKQRRDQPNMGKKEVPAKDNSGTEGPLVIEAEIGGHKIHRMYIDGGSSTEVLYEHCCNCLRPKIKNQMVPATTSLTSFSGETIWPLGQLRLLVTIGDAIHSTKAWMNFMIVRSLSPYNGIIGRPGIREIQAVPSTAHGMLKFPVDGGIMTICSTISIPDECATVITSSKEIPKEVGVRHENFKVALHPNFPDQEVAIGETLSAKGRTELCSLLKENLDIFAWQPSYMTGVPRSIAEHRLNIREGYSPVRQKERGQTPERAKAIQMEMAESDEEKTAFHTSHGVYCYTKMPFGLKNAGATYQRLVDKAFDRQVSRNIEVYVDDLVIKSHTEAKMLRDIDETFRTLRKINIKLNPKKCTFGAVEGMFLGYMISSKGIKPCPDKTDVVLQLPSPRTIKEVQSLNGKLASLNRFLSKSAEKSLPLFKTLKKCIKKSDFHWTPDAEQAFKQLKQHLSELPLLVAPKPKEELIVYMSASQGAISAVLMTERGTVQTLVYFVSRALQGPKLNYTPMEKLVLSLVFAVKRLRRYFQAHPIAILADFLVEKPDESSTDTSVVETPQEPWTLFTDGSSSSNNEAEYEALIAGLWIAAQIGVRNVHKVKSLVSGFANFSISQVPRSKNKKADALKYLKEGTLPDDKKEASKLCIKARQYELWEGAIYRRSFLKPWLLCIGPLQADYVIREIHEGSCSMHAGPRSVVAKAMRLGYYWPTMHRDA
ncbi:reverse transcriptase domain-containing protein [Tanacetum coccineum]